MSDTTKTGGPSGVLTLCESTPDDIGRCDRCGSEVGVREPMRWLGMPAWICEECV